VLPTGVVVDAEKNSTLAMPFPVELLWFFDRLPGLFTQAERVEASAGAGNGHGAAPLESEDVSAAQGHLTFGGCRSPPPGLNSATPAEPR
jgi:hypothetical protein